MATPSLFPILLKAADGSGPPVQTFTSEPITLDIDTSNIVSLEITADAVGIEIVDTPFSLDLDSASIQAQMGGDLEIESTPINLEIDSCP